jgi:hypothetical protein
MKNITIRIIYTHFFFLQQWRCITSFCTTSRSGHIIHENTLTSVFAKPKQQQQQPSSSQLFIDGPSQETKPNYEEINGPLGFTIDKVFLSVFRAKMADKVGIDSKLPYDDYQGLMEVANALNARFSEKEKVRLIAQDVLRKYFFVVRRIIYRLRFVFVYW